jgi:glycerophosphoryl diester phosphodiesterase
MIKIAHRGTIFAFPSNSLQGIKYALDCNSDWIEVDLRITSDHKFVLFHDLSLKKLLGISGTVKGTTWDVLRRLPIFHENKPSNSYIPLANEIIPLITQKATVLIDLKKSIKQADLVKFIEEISEKVNFTKVIFATRYFPHLKILKDNPMGIKFGVFISIPFFQIVLFGKNKQRMEYLFIHWRYCFSSLVRHIRRLGIKPIMSCAFPVDLRSKALSTGVDGYFINL